MSTKQHTALEIEKSISRHKDAIMEDINLILRILDGEKSYTTQIIKWNKNTITFSAPIFQRDWVIFDMSIKYDLYFITKSAMFSTRISLDHKYTERDKLCYSATLKAPVVKKQQREHFRLPALLNCEYEVFENATEDSESNIPQKYGATTLNISIGGICMVSDHKLTGGQIISIHLKFLKQELNLIGHVLSDGEKTASGSYTYRVKFKDLDPSTERLLSKLIFEKQRLLLTPTKRPLK